MFRYSQNLGSVTIQGESVLFKKDRTFSGTNSLKVLDMSAVKAITFSSDNDTNSDKDTSYFSNMGSNNKSPAVIYVSSSAIMNAVEAHRSSGYLTYAVTNGGTLKNPPTSNIELATPVKDGYIFDGWYENADFSGNAVTAAPTAGKTYYAKWTMADSISLTADEASVPYGSPITLTVAPTNSSWGYVWYKDANGNGTLELNADEQITNNKCTLALTNVSDSGMYWVLVNDGRSTKTSNEINVTITKAAVANTAKQNVRHTFGTTYDVSNLFGIDPNAGKATYALVENPDENAGAATLKGNILTITKAGVIKVSLTTAETDNYNAGSAVTATLIVDKAAPTVKISADQTSLTGSGTVKLTVTKAPTDAVVSVTCDDTSVEVKDNNDGTYTVTLPNTTKTYNFKAALAESANYTAADSTCTVSVTRRSSSSGSSSSNPTYSVTTPSKSENGGVAVSLKNARKGDAVTVTVTPDAGYQLDKLTITDKNGKELKLTDKGDGQYTFTMPDGKVEVKAVFVKKVETRPFVDVSADAYYNQAVQWAQEKGITDGISSNLFGPKQPCTRSQIVTFLWRAAGSPEPKGTAAGMADVIPDSYYAKAVAWAVENGITTGTAEGTFSPDATCTRAQAVTFLARAQNAKATGKTAFSDVPSDSYFADAVAWAQANGVTTGTSETTFSPDNDCTRAQIVTFLYRANQGT